MTHSDYFQYADIARFLSKYASFQWNSGNFESISLHSKLYKIH